MFRAPALSAALAALLLGAPSLAGPIAPLSGFWTAEPSGHSITGCDATLTPALELIARRMEASAGQVEITWPDGRFDAEGVRRAQPGGATADWYQPAADLIVAVPRYRGHAAADGPMRIVMRLTAPGEIETRILLDATMLRRLEGRPIARGTEACRLVIESRLRHDL